MMEIPTAFRAYWAKYEAMFETGGEAGPSERFYEAFHFGDNPSDADELAALVLAGTKRATASLAWTYEATAKPLPVQGSLSIVTRCNGAPLCIIESQRVEVVPYAEVSAAFAAVEGEGDGTLTYWRKVHWAYFSRECLRLGRAPRQDMPVVCEQFRVVYRG